MPSPDRAAELADALAGVRVVLCDADGNLFPSEEPAFAASTDVTNAFLQHLGSPERWDADELRAFALGRNFRVLAGDLARESGTPLTEDDLGQWVAREQEAVTARLVGELRPDRRVTEALEELAERLELAVVTSSALARVGACLDVTGLARLFPAARVFSAQDSLPMPTSKPDPAVYVAALRELGREPGEAVAVEDAVAGVRSAVGAGIPVIGNLAFVPHDERAGRAQALREAGALLVVEEWEDLVRVVLGRSAREGAQEAQGVTA